MASAHAWAPQAGLTSRIQVGVAVDDQQGHLAQPVQYGAHGWEFAQIELARPVRRYVRHQFGALGYQTGACSIGGHHGGRPGTAGRQVLHVHRHEHTSGRVSAILHSPRMPDGNCRAMAEGPRQSLAEAALYPWYEITFYPAADALTSGCADDRRMSVSLRHGGGRNG
jgi:hypothetical protein